MTTESELRQAYVRFTATAPGLESIHLPAATGGRSRAPRWLAPAAAAVVVLLVATATLVVTRTKDGTDHSQTATPTVVPYRTQYDFGPDSLPGYQSAGFGLNPEGQGYTYSPSRRVAGVPVAAVVAVSTFTPTSQIRSQIASLQHVRVGNSPAYFSDAKVLPGFENNAWTGVVWQFSPGRWVSLSADTPDSGAPVSIARADVLKLASLLRPSTNNHAAFVKVGYVPSPLKFDGVSVYAPAGTQNPMPDGTSGANGQRMIFIDRSADTLTSWVTSMEITATDDPGLDLADATSETLPQYNNGPWTKTTVKGHLAWTSPYDVLVQWGKVQISVSSLKSTSSGVQPILISHSELMKVARSLTVGATSTFGQGFALDSALPPNAYR